jgi:guanosine-3',5'-bis(diphosphate) 3'-pyrophosphohydrolase
MRYVKTHKSFDIIEKVKELATRLHGDQKRKYSGDPYVSHTFRVSDTVKENGGDESMVYAAILHDVLEDTPTTESELLNEMLVIVEPGVAMAVVRLVKELTDIFTHESYPDMNRSGRKEMEAIRMGRISPKAQTIKYADLLDNGKDVLVNDPKFAKVYLKEKENILRYMNRGNKTLYQKCLDFLEN